jgi:uncharacterized membrane protein
MRESMLGISIAFEMLGVVCIVVGFGLALLRAGMRSYAREFGESYRVLRETFGRSILLGLEILVAADLIRTLAVEPSLENLTVLAMLVAIRTFLSWSLDVEIDGAWPWQRGAVIASVTGDDGRG